MNYQKQNGLTVDGKLGPQTLAKMGLGVTTQSTTMGVTTQSTTMGGTTHSSDI